MLPALLLVRVGGCRRIWIPVPLLLLWPFWLLGWAAWVALWILRHPWARVLREALIIGACLSGVKVDVDSADGDHVHLRMI